MAGKSMIYRTAQEIDSGLRPPDGPCQGKRHQVLLFGGRVPGCRPCGTDLRGARHDVRKTPSSGLTRDVRLERIWEGTSEIQKVIMAGQIMKRGLDPYTGWT